MRMSDPNTSIKFCLSFSRRTYTIQSLSLLKRLFACTPLRTTSLLLWAPATCRLTASHMRGSFVVSARTNKRYHHHYHPLRLLLSRSRVVQPAPLLLHLSHTVVDISPFPFPDLGESVQVRSKESVQKDVTYLSPQEHKRFKHGREVPPAA
jgi:hypothetical protein